jgi:hypothetical protein
MGRRFAFAGASAWQARLPLQRNAYFLNFLPFLNLCHPRNPRLERFFHFFPNFTPEFLEKGDERKQQNENNN